MIVYKDRNQCCDCRISKDCKNKEVIDQFKKEVEKVKVGYPELETMVVCLEFKAIY